MIVFQSDGLRFTESLTVITLPKYPYSWQLQSDGGDPDDDESDVPESHLESDSESDSDNSYSSPPESKCPEFFADKTTYTISNLIVRLLIMKLPRNYLREFQ